MTNRRLDKDYILFEFGLIDNRAYHMLQLFKRLNSKKFDGRCAIFVDKFEALCFPSMQKHIDFKDSFLADLFIAEASSGSIQKSEIVNFSNFLDKYVFENTREQK